MSESPVIVDPSALFVDEQQDDLVDYIFRMTGDRSRAALMGREACRLMKDELSSQLEKSAIRARLFQLAYELSEEALRPIARGFIESWFRLQHRNPKTVATAFRWELRLLELGHHATQLLLLRYRYRFNTRTTAWIMFRDESDVIAELMILEKLVQEEHKLELDALTQLPRYGFLDVPDPLQTTALSALMRQFRPRDRWWPQIALLAAFMMFAIFFWLVREFFDFTQVWGVMRSWFL